MYYFPSAAIIPSIGADNNIAYALNGNFAFAPRLFTDGSFLGIGDSLAVLPNIGDIRLELDTEIYTLITGAPQRFLLLGEDIVIGSAFFTNWTFGVHLNGLYTFQHNAVDSFIIEDDRLLGITNVFLVDLTGPAYGTSFLVGPTTRTVTITAIDTWTTMAQGAGRFAAGPSSGHFSTNTTTGELSYNGPTRAFNVSLQCVLDKQGASTEWIELVIDLNGVLVGTTTNPVYSVANTITPGSDRSFFCERIVTLNTGDILRPLARNAANADDLDLHLLQMTARPVSA